MAVLLIRSLQGKEGAVLVYCKHIARLIGQGYRQVRAGNGAARLILEA